MKNSSDKKTELTSPTPKLRLAVKPLEGKLTPNCIDNAAAAYAYWDAQGWTYTVIGKLAAVADY